METVAAAAENLEAGRRQGRMHLGEGEGVNRWRQAPPEETNLGLRLMTAMGAWSLELPRGFTLTAPASEELEP